MDPASWKDPENFRPERFLDSDNKIINSKKVIAFGMGRQACCEKIILASDTSSLFHVIMHNYMPPTHGQPWWKRSVTVN